MIQNYYYWNKIRNTDGRILIYRLPIKFDIQPKQTSENNQIWTWKKLFLKNKIKFSSIV